MLGKQPDESAKHVEHVLSLQPDNMDALYLRARLYDQEKDLPKAAATFNRMLDLNRSETRAYLGLAAIYERQKDTPKAVEILERAVSIDSKNIKPQLMLALSLYEKRRCRKGRKTDQGNHCPEPGKYGSVDFAGQFLFSAKKNR